MLSLQAHPNCWMWLQWKATQPEHGSGVATILSGNYEDNGWHLEADKADSRGLGLYIRSTSRLLLPTVHPSGFLWGLGIQGAP